MPPNLVDMNGRSISSDSKERQMNIYTQEGKVILDFGKPELTHIGFDAVSTIEVAKAMVEKAGELMHKKLTITIHEFG